MNASRQNGSSVRGAAVHLGQLTGRSGKQKGGRCLKSTERKWLTGRSSAASIDIWQTGRYVSEKTDVLLMRTWQALICFIASSMCAHASSSSSTLKQDIPLKSQSVHKQLSADIYGPRKGCCDGQVLWITKVFEKLYRNIVSAKHTILSCQVVITDFKPHELFIYLFSPFSLFC